MKRILLIALLGLLIPLQSQALTTCYFYSITYRNGITWPLGQNTTFIGNTFSSGDRACSSPNFWFPTTIETQNPTSGWGPMAAWVNFPAVNPPMVYLSTFSAVAPWPTFDSVNTQCDGLHYVYAGVERTVSVPIQLQTTQINGACDDPTTNPSKSPADSPGWISKFWHGIFGGN